MSWWPCHQRIRDAIEIAFPKKGEGVIESDVDSRWDLVFYQLKQENKTTMAAS